MKKLFLFLALTLLCACAAALADEARDITAQATLRVSGKPNALYRISDRNYETIWKSGKARKANIEVTSEEPVYGVYVCLGMEKLSPWVVEVPEGKKWVTAANGPGIYGHEYLPLPGLTHFRLSLDTTAQKEFAVNELYLLSEGELPDWVQVWQPTVEKADLMILVGHPDDEMLFFGGMIPTMAGERGLDVVVCYMTCNYPGRRSELLNGLWYCGVRNYPDIGNFWDKYSLKLKTQYDTWGRNTVHRYVTGLIRRYRPEVIATHDINGEYGHGAHRVCADACLECVRFAADPDRFTQSAETYGVWQAKKLYIHMYKQNEVEFDWDVPLESQGGKTGYETAVEAYKLYVSQQQPQYRVEPRDSEKSCYRFGLAFTTVGPDTLKNDPFENITLD